MARPPAPPPPPPAPRSRSRLALGPARSVDSVALDREPLRGARAGELVQAPPFVPWPAFYRQLDHRWLPGPPNWPNTHMAIIGRSRSGKSRFARAVVELRDRVCLFGTKLVDEPLYGPLTRDGWKIKDRWNPQDTSNERVIFRPPLRDASKDSLARQQEAFRSALMQVFRVGGWTIWLDEVRYLTEQLKLSNELNLLWLQGGSGGTTIVALTQRPVSVPLNMFEQSRYLITFRIVGVEDRRTMAGYAGAAQPTVFAVAERLPKYELLFVDTEDDYMARTRVTGR
jgi:hypothetical protein